MKFLSSVLALLLFGITTSVALAATLEPVIVSEPKNTNQFPVFIFLDTEGKETIGTDILLQYDPKKLVFVKSKVKKGELYPNHHEAVVNEKLGQVRYSATVDSKDESVTGAGNLVTLYFRKKNKNVTVAQTKTEPSALQLVWKPDATNDTNVVSVDGVELLATAPAELAIDKNAKSNGSVKGTFDDGSWQRLQEEGTLPEGILFDIATTTSLAVTNAPLAVLGILIISTTLVSVIVIAVKKKKNRLA